MKRKLALASLSIILLSGCHTPKESEFDELSKRAEAVARDKNNPSSERARVRRDFDDWATKYDVKPVEQQGPKLLEFRLDRPVECDWFARLEQKGKSGSCFAKREIMVFENGAAKRACFYDCYYP